MSPGNFCICDDYLALEVVENVTHEGGFALSNAERLAFASNSSVRQTQADIFVQRILPSLGIIEREEFVLRGNVREVQKNYASLNHFKLEKCKTC